MKKKQECLSVPTPFRPSLIFKDNEGTHQSGVPGPILSQHYEFVMYRLCSKLAFLPKSVKVNENIKDNVVCSFFVQHESEMFHCVGPG